jgi:hypothetical protein
MMTATRLTDLDRRLIERARVLLDAGGGADSLREHTGEDGSPYAAAFGEARYYLAELVAIAERLDSDAADDDDDDLPETFLCATCGATIAIFIGHGDGWHHYTGNGTAAHPTVLYDADHPATLTGLLP